MAMEVAAEAARRAGVRLAWVEAPEGPDRALRSGKVDLWPMLADLPDRAASMHITDPWIASEPILITRGEPPGEWTGVRVSYGLGYPNMVTQSFPGATPVYFSGESAAMEAVCRGTAEAAMVLRQALTGILLNHPAGCQGVQLRITAIRGDQIKLGIGSTFAAAPVADLLRRHISRMAAEGALAEILHRFTVYTSDNELVLELVRAQWRSRVFAWGAAALTVVLAALLLLVRRVRHARRIAVLASSAKSQFLANMSHELRTPLNGIMGMVELLAQTSLNPEQCEMLGIVRNSSESLLVIVDDILSFSNIERGGIEKHAIEFDLRVAMEGIARLAAPQANAKGLSFEVHVSPVVPQRVKTDPILLRQTLMNLISNAIKFTDTGEVRLELLPGGDPAAPLAVLFRVKDTGIGMRPDLVSRLFTPFTQGDSSAARRHGGTGLGLAISRRLVGLLDGSMGVESELGVGSTFWFLLPLEPVSDPEEQPPEMPEAENLPTSQGRVLVVDDNPVNQLVTVRAVGSLGYLAEVVSGGREALAALERDHFDLVLMDCQMPEMDGYTATAEIRRRELAAGVERPVPIVAMTANAIEGDEERCRAAGMDDYLRKPIRMTVLGDALKRWAGPVQPLEAPH